ncbi:MAG: class I SAM-dependent methyltransferase [Planctomycetota bacterium]
MNPNDGSDGSELSHPGKGPIQTSQFAYDRVAYTGAPDPLIHLRHLEVASAMFGLRPSDISSCRVLELGCADGTNLLPYAVEFEGGTFVGVDLAIQRIQKANQAVETLRLSNISFHHADVCDIGAELGQFDYVLVPGVYSWATEEARDAIIRICRECLRDDGVATISYNTRPGWNWMDGLREFMTQRVNPSDPPEQQIAQARGAVELLASLTPASTAHGAYYQRVRDDLRQRRDTYLYHEYLTNHSQSFYFHEFEQQLRKQGLKYVADADFKLASGFGLDSNGRAAIARTPAEEKEQLRDFLLHTSYRRSIICHEGVVLTETPQHEHLQRLEVVWASSLRDRPVDSGFSKPIELPFDEGSVTISDPLTMAAIGVLKKHWPHPIPFTDLHDRACESMATVMGKVAEPSPNPDQANTLARTLLAFQAVGLLKAFRTSPRIAKEISNRPRVGPQVRFAAKHGLAVVNQWHTSLPQLSGEQRHLLAHLDGNHDQSQLAEVVSTFRNNNDAPDGGSITTQPRDSESVETMLRSFAEMLLLMD